MYYLLGFRMIRHCDETVQEAVRQNKLNELVNWGDSKQLSMDKVGLSHIFSIMDYHVAKKVCNPCNTLLHF